MYIVYGLEDQRTHEVFYVGITDNIQVRYATHLRCDGTNAAKDARIQAMIEAGYMPLPRTLQIVGCLDQAKRRESYWIRHYYDLGMLLTNQVIPLIQENIVVVQALEPTQTRRRLYAGMPQEEQREYITSLLREGIPHSRIIARVKDYIHPNYVARILEEFAPVEPNAPKQRKNQAEKQVPEMIRKEIEERYANGMKRTEIRDDLQLNGDQYWMVRTVCDDLQLNGA